MLILNTLEAQTLQNAHGLPEHYTSVYAELVEVHKKNLPVTKLYRDVTRFVV
ncbi:MAG: hypothetical protein L0958_00750 [Candidatus Mariimomonas ferrooxydans]